MLCLNSSEAGRHLKLKDEDVLVLPMDVTKFESHQDCLETVLSHFGKVYSNTLYKYEVIGIRCIANFRAINYTLYFSCLRHLSFINLLQLDILLHNAGRSQRANWEKIDIAVDKEVFDLNVFSAIHLTRIAIPHFTSCGAGSIAVMSSAAGKLGVPLSGTYTGSKHALQARIFI